MVIRIDRGVESPDLKAVRGKNLPAAAAARAEKREISFDGYGVIRDALYDAQYGKCVYCERLVGREGQPLEHFRPKAEAWRGDPWTRDKRPIDSNRYWWLAWSDSNLFFACTTCNCPNRKSNWFPLEPKTTPLPVPRGRVIPETHPGLILASERPLLVDPAVDDPLEHIVWRPLDEKEPVEFMEWRPFHKSERGRYTIKILGLDRGVF